MAVEFGKEYNPETAQDLRTREFVFAAWGTTFTIVLQIPEYILSRLDSTALDKLHDHMDRHCQTVVNDALKGGYLTTEQGKAAMYLDVTKQLKNYIWERFSVSQENAGNGCWQVAPSLQEVLTK